MILDFVMSCHSKDPELRDDFSELFKRHLNTIPHADMMESGRFTILNSAKGYLPSTKVGLMSL